MTTVRDAGFSCLSLAVAAWENIRFSSLFAAGDVSRGGTSFLRASEEKRMFSQAKFHVVEETKEAKEAVVYFVQEF